MNVAERGKKQITRHGVKEKGALRLGVFQQTRLLTAAILLRDDPMVKRILRGVVKTIALVAALVFFFDNRVTGTAGTVPLGSIVVAESPYSAGIHVLSGLYFDMAAATFAVSGPRSF